MMKFKNYELEHFLGLLFDLRLKGKESRLRTRLHRMIVEYMDNVFIPERDGIIHQYGMKNDNDELILNEDQTSVKVIPELITEFNKEFNELLNEEYIIEENETNKAPLISVGRSLLECDIEFNGELAMLFDAWCEKFEEVIERYADKEGQ